MVGHLEFAIPISLNMGPCGTLKDSLMASSNKPSAFLTILTLSLDPNIESASLTGMAMEILI